MAAVMSSDMDHTDKVVTFIHECESMALTVLSPSINQSEYSFTVVDEATILYGLGAIKGVGESAIQCIAQERALNGPYDGLFSLCQRLDMRKVNRRVLEALIKSGAMDVFGVERAVLYESIDKAIQVGAAFHQNKHSGQGDLLFLFDDAIVEDYVDAKVWGTKQRLDAEKETLGLYLTGHPAEPYHKELGGFVQPIAELNPLRSKKVVICGLINGIRKLLTKRGKKLAIIQVEDSSGSMDIVAFSEVFEPQQAYFSAGKMVVVEGELGQDDYTGGIRMTATALYRLEEARVRFAKCLALTLSKDDQALIPRIQSVLKVHQGECVVQIRYANSHAKAAINLAPEWRVMPSDELLLMLMELLEEGRVEMCY
jgi:DNA polymerase-3 subunit alpha